MPTHVKEGNYVLAVEAAHILGVTQRRVTQLIDLGRLPATKVHTAVLIPHEAVIERRDRLAAEREALERRKARRAKLEAAVATDERG